VDWALDFFNSPSDYCLITFTQLQNPGKGLYLVHLTGVCAFKFRSLTC